MVLDHVGSALLYVQILHNISSRQIRDPLLYVVDDIDDPDRDLPGP